VATDRSDSAPGACTEATSIDADQKAWRADLIAMGTHGRRGFSPAGLGSDADDVGSRVLVPLLRGRSA
jgi:nucleotide-binding universal stress UspA family protein